MYNESSYTVVEGLPHKKDSMGSVAINARRALFPPTPPSYVGNVVFVVPNGY